MIFIKLRGNPYSRNPIFIGATLSLLQTVKPMMLGLNVAILSSLELLCHSNLYTGIVQFQSQSYLHWSYSVIEFTSDTTLTLMSQSYLHWSYSVIEFTSDTTLTLMSQSYLHWSYSVICRQKLWEARQLCRNPIFIGATLS